MIKSYRLMGCIIRRYRNVQITTVLAALAVYVTIGEFVRWPMWAAFMAAAAVFGIITYAIKAYLQYEYRQIGKCITDDCDPQAHTDAYSRLIAQVEKGGTAKAGWLWTHMAMGLLLAGRAQDALAAIQKSPALPKDAPLRQSDTMLALTYHNSLLSAYLDMKDLRSAAQQLALYEKALVHLKHGKARDRMTRSGKIMACALRMAHGDFGGAEDVFLEALKHAEHTYARVSARFALGKIYAHAGQTDKARDAFEYVADNGNKLNIADVARVQIDKTDAKS